MFEEGLAVEREEGGDLVAHPNEGDLIDFVFVFVAGCRAAADVGVIAGEPALHEVRCWGMREVPEGWGEGGAALVEGKGMEGVLDALDPKTCKLHHVKFG